MTDSTTHPAPSAASAPTTASTVTFEPPAPGQWELETAHHGLRPLTPYLRDTYANAGMSGIVEPMERYGLPLASMEVKFIHGCLYMRPLAVGEKPGSTPKAPPPAFVMKVLSRLHPELRRRAKTAERAFAERRWRQEVDEWFDRDRCDTARREPRAPGDQPRRTRRRRVGGAPHHGARALRQGGVSEPRDPRR